MGPLVLTFDIGTQSIRALLINKKGQSELMAQIRYDSPFLPPKEFGQAEQEPDFYYEKICDVASKLKEKAEGTDLFERIKAVTISCMRDTVVILDKNHKPLRNIILWMDARRASKKLNPGFFWKTALSIVGMSETAEMLYKDAFFNWIMENEPDNFAKIDKFLMLPSYINYKLTGTLKDSVANQVGHIPFDNKKRTWIKKGLPTKIIRMPDYMHIDLVESGEVIGYINKETSEKSGIPEGLPLIATGTDKACEGLGLGVITPEKCAVSLGTAATVQFCTNKYFEPEPFLPSYPAIMHGYYNPENQIYRGFWTITWFIKEFCSEEKRMAEEKGIHVEEVLDEYLKEVPAGCNGLIMTPHLAPGAGNPFAKGLITGLNDRHTKKHLYRAIVEGVCFELYHAKNRMERRSGMKMKEVYAAGGGSSSDTVLQILADIFGLPVKRIQTHEVTGIGASIAAFVGLGEFETFEEAVKNMVHDKDVFNPNPETRKLYSDIYNDVYKHLEKRNTKIFRRIKK